MDMDEKIKLGKAAYQKYVVPAMKKAAQDMDIDDYYDVREAVRAWIEHCNQYCPTEASKIIIRG